MILVDCVSKYFGRLPAVERVSFQLPRDRIVGFVGPNGAGKSTLLRLLATYLEPTAGRLEIDGVDCVRRPLEARAKIGYLPGDTPLYQEMRTGRFLEFIGAAHGLANQRLDERLHWVSAHCGLKDVWGKRIKQCSTGYRKRIGLAAALIHDPPVILLDEPTHGLDPLQLLTFRKLLRKLRPGRTILLSSHVISEVATLCERVLLIHNGQLLADGEPDTLCGHAGVKPGDLEGLFVCLVGRHDAERSGTTEGGDAA